MWNDRAKLDRFVPVLYAIVAGAIIAYVSSSRWGLSISNDSWGYLTTANAISSQGIRFLFEKLSVEQPPFYPFLLAFGAPLFHGELLAWARILNIVLAAATIFLVGRIAERNFDSPLCVHLALFACLFSLPLLNTVWVYVWTETPFIVLCLLSLRFCAKRELNRQDLAIASLTIVLACMTRYAGVVLIPVAMMACVTCRRNTPKRTIDWKRFAMTVAVPAVCFAAWTLRNWLVSGTLLGPRHEALATLPENLQYLSDTVRAWFVPGQIVTSRFVSPIIAVLPDVPLFGLAVIAILAMPVAMRARCARGEKECESVPREIAVQALFALVYMAFIVVSSTTTGYDRIGNRLLAPAYPSMVLVLVYMLAHALRNLPKQTSRVISICVLSASLLCGLAWLGSRLPVSYLMLACAGCISSTLAFLLVRKGWTARDVAMFSLVVPLLLLSAVSAWSMMKSWMVNGSGMNSDYFFDPEMAEFLHLELTSSREIFCDEGRYAMDSTLNVRILPRSRHYQSVVPTGLTPENILDSRPELDGALLILRADTIPDGFVNLFDSGFSGRLDLLKRFRTGSVWEIRREEIEAVE